MQTFRKFAEVGKNVEKFLFLNFVKIFIEKNAKKKRKGEGVKLILKDCFAGEKEKKR